MVLFKIYGERNSGTNFMIELIKRNFGNIYTKRNNGKIVHYWKHGLPCNSIKDNDEKVVEIFIFRELTGWLSSMYKNPYHLKKFRNFGSFLTHKQCDKEHESKDFRNMESINRDSNNKTIFEIRYYKMQKILDYIRGNDNTIIVGLDYLQKKQSNILTFLESINKTYSLGVENYTTELKHTKTKTFIQNRIYKDVPIKRYERQILRFSNKNYEKKINTLQFIIKVNPSTSVVP